MPKVRNSYDEDTLQKALSEIKKGIPKKVVANKFGIPRSTLQFRLGPNFIKARPGPNTYLSKSEKETLVNWLVDSHKKGFPRRTDDIYASVKKYLDENPRTTPFKNNRPGNHWLKSFLNRHEELTIRMPEAVTSASGNVAEADIRKWFDFDILEDSSRVFNGDETCFQLCPNAGKVLAPRGSKNVYEIDQGTAKANLTVMFTFSASGTITPPMVIYPYKRLPPNIAESVPAGWGIGMSDNGWMKSEFFF